MQLKIKKEVIRCESCGASDFTYDGTIATCEYCGTTYRIENAEQIESEPNEIHTVMKKPVGIVIAVVILALILLGLGSNIAYEAIMSSGSPSGRTWTNNDTDDVESIGMDNITAVPGWTLELYHSITLAQRQVSGDTVTFAHGELFTDLVDMVGVPNRTHSFTFMGTTEITASWMSPDTENYFVSISISYDEDTGYITNKSIMGFSNLFGDEEFTSSAFGLAFIDYVEGWSVEKFESIQVATEHSGNFDEPSTFTDGDYIKDVESVVGRANEIFINDRGFSTATWTNSFDDPVNVTVTIVYLTDNGMITDKRVWGFEW